MNWFFNRKKDSDITDIQKLVIGLKAKIYEREQTEKIMKKIVAPFKWYCTKYQECEDRKALCVRTTDEPCAHRVLNPNYVQAMKDTFNEDVSNAK